MTTTPPKIDSRDQQKLYEQVRDLALYYCPEWKDEAVIGSDKNAEALMRIFARMMEIIIQRLNKIPDKNFLAFLDMVGTSLFPPRVARAPLTFTMAKGETKYLKISGGIQVATTQTKEKEAIVFETAKDLTIISPKLTGVVSISPDEDKWADQTAILSGNTKETVVLFKGIGLIPHRLYIGDSELFSLKEKASITVDITFNSNITGMVPWNVNWYYYDENSAPKSLDVDSITSQDVVKNEGKVTTYLKIASIKFKPVGGISEKTLTEKPQKISWIKQWIYAELNVPIQKNKLPIIKTIKGNVSISSIGSPVPPDIAFFNNFPIDLTKDFYPFGERPKFNDTFYIGSKEVFSKNGATVTLAFTLSEGVDKPEPQNIKLRWELWNGDKWDLIGDTTSEGLKTDDFTDGTNAFTIKGSECKVIFKITKTEPLEINAQENHWIRVRIIEGNYGMEAKYYEQTVATNEPAAVTDVKASGINRMAADTSVKPVYTNYLVEIYNGIKQKKVVLDDGTITHVPLSGEKTEWIVSPPTFKPPSIKKLTLEYSFDSIKKIPEVVLTYNDFTYSEQTDACKDETKTFTPFQPVADTQKAVYLAFDKDISTLPVTMFFPLLENMFTVVLDPASNTPPVIAWEYWTGKTWSLLSAEDGTRNLTRMEMVQFLASDDVKNRYCFEFGSEYYWIRARLDKGNYENFPRLKGIYTNTVWAYNHITVDSEIMGSSNGKTSQVFNFSHFPVLPGQKVRVHEISLTDEEKSTIRLEEGKDAIEETKDDDGNIIGYWVRWHEKNHFYSSGTHSRHYTIDRNKGTITFGDGERGMIPPAEKDNIQCSYQYGGGMKGNFVGLRSITKLKTAFPLVESVTNQEDSDGGGDQEDLDRLMERGPQTIKHRDRAVTYEDFEWLVREASPKVAAVKCLPTTDPGKNFRPGWITMIIVPDERENPKPVPTMGLINQIEDYIFYRTSTYLTTNSPQIKFVGPGYIQVGVEAMVYFTSITDAKIIEGRIIDNLKRFFHPLMGGPGKKGWDFGRNVYISEVYELIENTDGVDHVGELFLKASIQVYELILEDKINITGTYPENSRVETTDGKITFSLAEKLPEEEIDTLNVVGFKEGDSIILSHYDKFLFCWEEIPGNDSLKFIDFLKQNYSIDWVKTGKIEKIDNLRTIRISAEKNYLTLNLDNYETKVTMIIDDGRTDEYSVKLKNDKLNIYKDKRANLVIRSVSHERLGDILECESSQLDNAYPVQSIVTTTDGRIRSFILNEVPAGDISLIPLKISTPRDGESYRLSRRDDPSKQLTGKIKKVNDHVNKIFIETNYIVYSGEHSVNTKVRRGPVYPYLMNTNQKEIHDLNNEQTNCKLNEMSRDNMIFIKNIDNIGNYDYCRWCFGPEMSKR
ncbi:Baseplate J-like protein [uncultured archaeon]|nr:Baseplate J-like protein [uncultured archaeon]